MSAKKAPSRYRPQPPNMRRTVTAPKSRSDSTTSSTNSLAFGMGYRCPKMASGARGRGG